MGSTSSQIFSLVGQRSRRIHRNFSRLRTQEARCVQKARTRRGGRTSNAGARGMRPTTRRPSNAIPTDPASTLSGPSPPTASCVVQRGWLSKRVSVWSGQGQGFGEEPVGWRSNLEIEQERPQFFQHSVPRIPADRCHPQPPCSDRTDPPAKSASTLRLAPPFPVPAAVPRPSPSDWASERARYPSQR